MIKNFALWLLGIDPVMYEEIRRRLKSSRPMIRRERVISMVDRAGFVVDEDLTVEERVAAEQLVEHNVLHRRVSAFGDRNCVLYFRKRLFVRARIVHSDDEIDERRRGGSR